MVYPCVCVLSHFSHVQLCVTPWTVARQAPLSMGISRQEYWSGQPCPPPGDLPDPGIEPLSLRSPALVGKFPGSSAIWEAQYTHVVIVLKICISLFQRKKKKKNLIQNMISGHLPDKVLKCIVPNSSTNAITKLFLDIQKRDDVSDRITTISLITGHFIILINFFSLSFRPGCCLKCAPLILRHSLLSFLVERVRGPLHPVINSTFE